MLGFGGGGATADQTVATPYLRDVRTASPWLSVMGYAVNLGTWAVESVLTLVAVEHIVGLITGSRFEV